VPLPLPKRERGQKRRDPLSLWERVRVRVTAVYRFNRLIQISIRRALYRPLPDKRVRGDDLKLFKNMLNNYFHVVNN